MARIRWRKRKGSRMATRPVHLPGAVRKNDEIFCGAFTQTLPWVKAYCQDTTEVVHGPSCKVEKEIDTERCEADGVAIVSRRGGGGTVVLSPGMLITVVVGKRRANDSVLHVFSRIHRAMIALIEEAGGPSLEEEGTSDLAFENRKVLGSSLYLCNRPYRYFYQSSLMVGSDVSLLSRYLKHPPKEPRYREGRDHTDFCTTLCACGCALGAPEIADVFNRELGARISALDGES